MSALDIFKKAGGLALDVAAASGVPLAQLASAVVTEIIHQQTTSSSNDIKKRSVESVARAEAKNTNITLSREQIDQLIEGMLEVMKKAAAAGAPK